MTVSSLVDILRDRNNRQPDRRVYTFLADGETATASLSYGELDERARAIGAFLQSEITRNERVLLLFAPGLEFVTAFFGVLYGGAIAVPAAPPHHARPTRNLSRLLSIVRDAQPRIVLTSSQLLPIAEPLARQAAEFGDMKWFAVDNIASSLASGWAKPAINREEIALLQYTSGSTGKPKGVMVGHGNILHNSAYINKGFGHSEESVAVTWLPSFHDMGLIDGILQPVFGGFSTYIMSPASFLQRPMRWLEAVSKYRATHSGGPNFAYELCVRTTTPEQRAALDLSNWRIAYNGAEPIREETLAQFSSAFAGAGFQSQAFYPCYGLAEGTLKITGRTRGKDLVYCDTISNGQEKGAVIEAAGDENAITQVSSGTVCHDMKVAIVDPETLQPSALNYIGEIWAAGPSIAQGYWQRPVESAETFQAYLPNGEGPFLRTGDLGFIKDGELFVTGRLKDLIIIRGRNYYPQDIEWNVENCHPALRSSACAAFSITLKGEEKLVVAVEVERHYRPTGADESKPFDRIREVIAENFDLQVFHIALLKYGSIPKTSSGKIQRQACRGQFIADELEIVDSWSSPQPPCEACEACEACETDVEPVGVWVFNGANKNGGQMAFDDASTGAVSADAVSISSWVTAKVAAKAHIPAHKVDPDYSLINYGIDSVAGTSFAQEVSTRFGLSIAATLIWDYPTVNAIVSYLLDALMHKAPKSEEDRLHQPDQLALLMERLERISDDDAARQLISEKIG